MCFLFFMSLTFFENTWFLYVNVGHKMKVGFLSSWKCTHIFPKEHSTKNAKTRWLEGLVMGEKPKYTNWISLRLLIRRVNWLCHYICIYISRVKWYEINPRSLILISWCWHRLASMVASVQHKTLLMKIHKHTYGPTTEILSTTHSYLD